MEMSGASFCFFFFFLGGFLVLIFFFVVKPTISEGHAGAIMI